MVAERELATDLKLVRSGEVAAQWAQPLRLGTDGRVSSEKMDGLDVAGMTSVLASFDPDLIMQCASLLSSFALLAPRARHTVSDGDTCRPNLPLPIAEENGERLKEEDLVTRSSLRPGRQFNYLTAVTAIPVVTALLDEDIAVRAHVPEGLPGGYPICFRRESIELDLPAGILEDEAVEFKNLCAWADGVERIESDGTPIYTEDARRTAKPFCAELAEPLSPKHWESRLDVLRSFYEHCLRTR
jgi:hypothetical protein